MLRHVRTRTRAHTHTQDMNGTWARCAAIWSLEVDDEVTMGGTVEGAMSCEADEVCADELVAPVPAARALHTTARVRLCPCTPQPPVHAAAARAPPLPVHGQ